VHGVRVATGSVSGGRPHATLTGIGIMTQLCFGSPRRRRLALLLTLLLTLAGSARAQGATDSLTLAAVYAALDAGTPRIEAAAATARAASERIGPARRPPDPELQLGLMNRELPGFGLSDPLGMNQIQLMQMVPIGGKLGLAAEVERARAAAADARVGEVRWEERNRAAMAFFELYTADRSIRIAEESRRLLRDVVGTTEAMYAVGNARQADVLRAQVELARMTEDLVRMEAMRAAAAARLNTVLDRPADAPVPPAAEPAWPAELPPADSLQALALARRPMLAAGAQAVRAARAGERLAGREIWPDLQVGLQYGWRGMDDGTEHMASVMLGVRLPIWAGSRQRAMRREAEAMRDMASADLAVMKAETRGRLGELAAGVGRARRLRELYGGTILPQARTTAASALAAYRVGGVDFMTLLEAQMNVNRYRLAAVAAAAELGQAIAELEMLTATSLLSGGVR
ncbi:MAG TPA: TolC family protein, partial [Gemmatimonadales bacterium]|nr:TolC family protein [Gemmatimonadales bacterium]